MVARYVPPDNTAQTGAPYKSNLDNAIVAGARLAIAFLPQAQTVPNMTVRVLAGALMIGGVLTEVAAQNTATITAPTTNPRIDRIVLNPATGAIERVAGTEAASPVAPAIPADRLPICRFQLATSTTQITDAMIVDERVQAGAGTGSASATATITAGENLADRDLIYQDLFNQRGGGATRWYKVDADATSPVRISPRLGIALAAITSGATGSAQVRPGRVAGFSGLTAGLGVWASATAGIVTQTEPAVPASGTQNAVRLIGYAASATEIDFDPDDDTVFVARNSALAVAGTLTLQHFTDAGARERIPHAYIAAALFSDTAAATLNVNKAGFGSYAFRQVINNAQITTSGSTIRVVLEAGSLEGFGFTTCRIGERAAAGNDWDFAATPTTVTFGGLDSGNVPVGGTLTSDPIAFSLDETKNYVVSFFMVTNSSADDARARTTQTGWTAYQKLGTAADASATAPTGFSAASDNVIGVRAVQVDTGTRAEPVTLGSETVNGGATDRATFYFADTSNANADTHTTAVNRTGATRDLIVEVTL